jgi:cob(I)alamin adenosyltransferase
MKIYTKTGDRGETGLFGGPRVRKDHIRVEAYGEVDELNSVLGVTGTRLEAENLADLAHELRAIQADLFAIGANLATPAAEQGGRASDHVPPFDASRIAQLEEQIDRADAELEPLRTFILPGGTEAAALLHVSRTVCRRAERRVVTLSRQAHIDAGIPIYLNRLSDLLFMLARLVNHRGGRAEQAWLGPRRTTDPARREPDRDTGV